MKYASIVPLIGGETIAMQNVFGKLPEYILQIGRASWMERV